VTYRKIFCSFQRNFSDKILIPFIGGRSPSREGLPKEIEFFKAVRKFIPPTSVMAPSTFLSQKKNGIAGGVISQIKFKLSSYPCLNRTFGESIGDKQH
jgi:hypothetical protein